MKIKKKKCLCHLACLERTIITFGTCCAGSFLAGSDLAGSLEPSKYPVLEMSKLRLRGS